MTTSLDDSSLGPPVQMHRMLGSRLGFRVGVSLGMLLSAASSGAQPRTRVSLDDDWRFALGDPPGLAVDLRYDVRPDVRDERDDRPADAQPRAATRPSQTAATVLKPWILPTGNRF